MASATDSTNRGSKQTGLARFPSGFAGWSTSQYTFSRARHQQELPCACGKEHERSHDRVGSTNRKQKPRQLICMKPSFAFRWWCTLLERCWGADQIRLDFHASPAAKRQRSIRRHRFSCRLDARRRSFKPHLWSTREWLFLASKLHNKWRKATLSAQSRLLRCHVNSRTVHT